MTQAEVLLPIGDVERLIGLKKCTIYRRIKEGKFPAPVRVTERCVRWRESDIRAWQDGLPQGVKAA